jgi:putative metallohydrolase (TIGR04338 family)
MAVKSQQQQIYRAERLLPKGQHFASLRGAQAWLDDLRDNWWWDHFYPRVCRVEVGSARSQKMSVGWYDKKKSAGRIELLHNSRNEFAIIHELAHVITMAYNDDDVHSPAFARHYCNLVYLIQGSERWIQLTQLFRENNVDYMQ